jgi:hypothetical protein
MENLGILCDYLVYFTAIGNILWPFGIFCGNLVYFPRFGILDKEKTGNPGLVIRTVLRARFLNNTFPELGKTGQSYLVWARFKKMFQ